MNRIQKIRDYINNLDKNKEKKIKRLKAAAIQLEADEITPKQVPAEFDLTADLPEEDLLKLKDLYIKLIEKAFTNKDYNFIYNLNLGLMTKAQKKSFKDIVKKALEAKAQAAEDKINLELDNLLKDDAIGE